MTRRGMTKASEYRLRDLVERLDQALELTDCADTSSVLNDAAAMLHELRFENGDNAMSDSPTFVAEFADGEQTRMTVFCASLKKLDVVRGVRLARHAYRSRMKQEPPPILKAHFASNGRILETYSAINLEDIDANDDQAVEGESDFEAVERIQEQREHRAHEESTYESPWEEPK